MQLIKYPKTMHFPHSPGLQNDDRVITTLEYFNNKEAVITEKYDGENTSIYTDHIHARSLDSQNHPSRNWVRAFAAKFQYKIPFNWRICGENMYAMHSIFYNNLPSYFLGFSIWDENNNCLNWNETLEWFKKFGIIPAREIYRGKFDIDLVKELDINDNQEGYVCRITDSFNYDDFSKYVAKYVRKNHVQTDEHWMNKEIIKNKLGE